MNFCKIPVKTIKFFKFDDSNLTSLIPQSKMPLFMYAKGDETLLSQERKRIAIVGTRKPSEASLFLTKNCKNIWI